MRQSQENWTSVASYLSAQLIKPHHKTAPTKIYFSFLFILLTLLSNDFFFCCRFFLHFITMFEFYVSGLHTFCLKRDIQSLCKHHYVELLTENGAGFKLAQFSIFNKITQASCCSRVISTIKEMLKF